MRITRLVEWLSGLAAGVLGLGVLAFILFGPSYNTASSGCTGGTDGSACTPTTYSHASLLEVGLSSTAAFYLGVTALILVGIAISAARHSQTGNAAWRGSLWTLTGLLLVFTCVGAASVGLFLLPSLLLAAVASVASFGNDRVMAL